MAKLMLFIDGTWVYSNVRNLAKVYGEEEFSIDYGKLPSVLAKRVGEQLGATEIDISINRYCPLLSVRKLCSKL
jgi:hypothetical protein